MTPEQWDRAKSIIELAVRHTPSERAAFVASACPDDPSLLRQIQSLLAEQGQLPERPAAPVTPFMPPPAPGKPEDGPTHDDAGRTEPSSSIDTHPAGIGVWGTLILLNEVGRGGFGTVYRAWDPALTREVALKIIAVPESDKEVARSVLAEGRLLARVRHPNVVTVYGAQQIGDQVGLWMEFVNGRTLQALIERDGPMAADEASVIGMAVCSALVAVHAAGLVHRDVKTRNVMREAGGRIVLMDFGTGREIRHLATMPAFELAGTPQYMAPEVLGGTPASASSDLYSVGILMYQLVTGKYPIKGGSFAEVFWAHQRGERRPLTEWRADLPDAFIHVVERALAPEPESRYRTAAQLKQDLATLVGRGATPPAVMFSPQNVLAAPDATPKTLGISSGMAVPTQTSTAVGVSSAWRTWVLLVLSAPLALGLLGFVNTTTFNLTMGRTGGFGWESPAQWIVWGFRSLVAPAVYMTIAVLPVLLVVSIVSVLSMLSPPIRARLQRLHQRVLAVRQSVGLDQPGLLAHILVGVGSLVLAVIAWRFRALILGYTSFISEVTADSLIVLQPDNGDEHIFYGRVLDMFILVFGLGFAYVLKVRRDRALPIGQGAFVCCVAILGLAVLLLEMPYQILWHNISERVDLDRTRCYKIGERPGEMLLHCPDEAPPRNRIVSAKDPRLKPRGTIESVFMPREQSLPRP